MQALFRYNWTVREEWYRWCEEVSPEELLRERTGGVGGILHTLFHIADVEWSWIRIMRGEPDFEESFDNFRSLEKVRELDARFRPEVESFVQAWEPGLESRQVHLPNRAGVMETHTWGELVRHVIAHEIHHIGQLSVWSRQLGKQPVSANFIWRGLMDQTF